MAQKIDMKITNPKICVKDMPLHGQGVFALSDIAKGEIFERCPYIVIDDDENQRQPACKITFIPVRIARQTILCDGFRDAV